MNNEITLEQILDEARVYRSLSYDISASWNAVLKWKHISQAELSRKTGLTEKSISLIVNGQRSGSIENIVLLCLAANLPREISEHLIRISGHSLTMSNEEHVVYNYLLTHKSTESLTDIRQFLIDIGSEMYMKIPVNI